MLSPKRTKYRKLQRGILKGTKATRCNTIDFGDFALVSTDLAFISARQIEAARIAMTRKIKRGGKVWIRIFPDVPHTSKAIGVRMGKGKGAVDGWFATVKPGTVLFEMAGVSKELAEEAMTLANSKLPIHTKFVAKREAE